MFIQGSGCSSVGRPVASDTRGPRFEFSHQETFQYLFPVNFIEQTKIKKKRPGLAHFQVSFYVFMGKIKNWLETFFSVVYT